MTSEETKTMVFKGYSILANFPPLMFDKCFLTIFIWEISAPLFKRSEVIETKSLGFIKGSKNKLEPPPQTIVINKSLEGFKDLAKVINFLVANWFFKEGKGWVPW